MTQELADHYHIARFCPKRCFDDGEVQASAFQLSERDKSSNGGTYLSVNWMEYFGNIEDSLKPLYGLYESKKLLKGTGSEHIAIMNVCKTKAHVAANTSDNRVLSVKSAFAYDDPLADRSHYGIFNMMPNEVAVAEHIRASVLRYITF